MIKAGQKLRVLTIDSEDKDCGVKVGMIGVCCFDTDETERQTIRMEFPNPISTRYMTLSQMRVVQIRKKVVKKRKKK